MRKKILVLGHSNIGDVCYDLAVIDPLLKNYPDAEIFFLTSSRCRDIVSGQKGIDEVVIFERNSKDRSLLSRLGFVSNLRKHRFDLVVVLKSSLVYLFLNSGRTMRYKKVNGVREKHPVDRYMSMLRSSGLSVDSVSFNFKETEDDRIFCDEFFKRKGINGKDILVGILPFAAWSVKSWPVEKWNKLAEILNDSYGIKTINLGKAPDNLANLSATGFFDKIIQADKTTLAQAKALLRRCNLFIGPDSSFLHLASCMGIETIGLYGATSSEYFYPYFHQQNIVYPGQKFSCMPCYPGPGPSCFSKETQSIYGQCMSAIDVDDVMLKVREKLNLKDCSLTKELRKGERLWQKHWEA